MADEKIQTSNASIARQCNRIIYIEPNDVYDRDCGNKQIGETLTPKYEDFCISFNLIIEQFQRFKTEGTASSNNNEDDETKTYSIEWGLTQEDMVKRRTSVLQGDRGEYITNPDGSVSFKVDDYNYLTTYFTDLSYDSYYKKTEIEGLGVESVQISYESWYTPTIVIKFVDVRGSSLFGREEAIHVDEKLTADNVFGAFFTMPYPLFRLQVKGFLGKPVTYQLTCSSFKGNFNSQTGNFEATATFIGYSWSLLTDIPFAYLVAAPYATYIGKDYWDRHVNTKEWGLWDDGDTTVPPPKLKELFRDIEKADEKFESEYSAASAEQNEILQSTNTEKTLLNEVNTSLDKFINSLEGNVGGNYITAKDDEQKKEQILLFHSANNLKVSQETITLYDKFYEKLTEYCNTYTSSGISKDKAPNKWTACPKDLTFYKTFNVNVNANTGNVTSISLSANKQVTIENIQKLTVCQSTKFKISKALAQVIRDNINSESKSNFFKNNASLIDLSDLKSLITDRIKILNNQESDVVQQVEEKVNYEIKKILGFKPFIGNIFKIIFCHLETFVHIMKDSAREIKAQADTGQRSPDYLGIHDITNTDQLNVSKDVTPWPAIYDRGKKTSECGYETEELANRYGWVGDISHNFIEEKVVYAIQEGIQDLAMASQKNEQAQSFTGFPITPYDLAYGKSPFTNVRETNISDLSGYLSMRVASIIGVLSGNNINTKLASLLGKMDAYNFYLVNGSSSSLKNIMGDKTKDDIKGISYCDNKFDKWGFSVKEGTNDRHHNFEIVKKIKDSYNNQSRHPMFKKVNNDDVFVHWYDNKGNGFVSTSLKRYSDYKEEFTFEKNDKKNTYFTPNLYNNSNGTISSLDWIYNCNSKSLSVLNDENSKSYTNKYMFNIVTETNKVSEIMNKYDQIKEGNCKVIDYEVTDDFSDYLNTFMKVGKEHTAKYFKGVYHMLSGNKAKLGIKDDNLLSNTLYGKSKVKYNFAYNGWDFRQNPKLKNEVVVNEKGDILLNGESTSIEDLVIQQFKVIHFGTECNIFGCPFYYLQNTRRNKEDDVEYNTRVSHVKAMLFLHTFKYDYYNTNLNVFSKTKKTGGLEAVPKGYLLLMSSLLWRQRYAKEHNNVDPVTYRSIPNGSKFDADSDIYKNPGIDTTFFVRENVNNNIFFRTIEYGNRTFFYNYKVKELFGGLETIDYNIENQLIGLFEDFVNNTFSKISSQYEIKDQLNNSVVKQYTSGKLKFDIESLYEHVQNIKNKKETSITFEVWLRNQGLHGWAGHYSALNVDTTKNIKKQGLKMLFNENDTDSQNLFKDLYLGSYVIADSCSRRMTKSDFKSEIKVNDSLYESYINGFIEATKNITDKNSVSTGGDNNMYVSPETLQNRDLSLAVYYYLKNLWDKWLVISKDDAFDVKNYFNPNFIFIDSFYFNTFHHLAINCQTLLRAWQELADNASLFNFLSRVVSDHDCMMLPVPDYIGFNGKSQKQDIEMMENLFRPLSYNAMEAPSNSNKFVVMYTYRPSSNSSEDNGYRVDHYDIWSHGKFTKEAEQLFGFKTTNSVDFDRDTDFATKEGYNVPSFGIAFSRQNNHIFKNINASMDNPVMTEQAIKAQYNIAKQYGSDKKVCFIGQDTFNIFSNYSYSVTVEMMGNAQICPLMYFQLLNIPLWRGTYMIYKVSHNMTAGNMTTTFTGMKMNKYAQPFNTKFFIYNKTRTDKSEPSDNSSSCDGNKTNSSVNVNQKWKSSVEKVAQWYQNNVHDYSQNSFIKCPLFNKNIRKDCSGFVMACLWMYGAFKEDKQIYSSSNFISNGNFAKEMNKYGFEKHSFDINNLKPYDIIVYNGHVEIYNGYQNGKHTSWSWGNVHDSKKGGLPCATASLKKYTTIWRINI